MVHQERGGRVALEPVGGVGGTQSEKQKALVMTATIEATWCHLCHIWRVRGIMPLLERRATKNQYWTPCRGENPERGGLRCVPILLYIFFSTVWGVVLPRARRRRGDRPLTVDRDDYYDRSYRLSKNSNAMKISGSYGNFGDFFQKMEGVWSTKSGEAGSHLNQLEGWGGLNRRSRRRWL